MDLPQLTQWFLSFGGVGVAVAAIVLILKLPALLTKGKIVIVPDGWAGNLAVLLNLAVFVVFVVLRMFYPTIYLPGVDAELQKYGQLAISLVGFVVQVWSSTTSYEKVFKPAAPKMVSYSEAGTFGARKG